MTTDDIEGSALSRQAVIDACLELLDSVGVAGLSMRAVADRLGVKAASLYWHIRDKEQLLALTAEAVLDRIAVPIAPAGWRGPVESACVDLVRSLREHPAAAEVVMGSLPAARRSRLVRELALTLAMAGLERAEAAAFALVVVAAAAAIATAEDAVRPRHGAPMTLAIDSGSWRVSVRAAPAGTVEVATSDGGGGAPSVDVRPDGLVVVRSRRGGHRESVELSPDHTWYAKVHGGTWNTTLDLSGLRVSGVEIDSGAGNVTCTLPVPVGVVPIRVNSGIVGVTLHRPRGTAVSATVSSGSAKVRFDGRAIRATTADVHWETTGAAASADRYEVIVCSGCVRVSLDDSAPDAPQPPLPPAPAGASEAAVSSVAEGVGLILDGIATRLPRR